MKNANQENPFGVGEENLDNLANEKLGAFRDWLNQRAEALRTKTAGPITKGDLIGYMAYPIGAVLVTATVGAAAGEIGLIRPEVLKLLNETPAAEAAGIGLIGALAADSGAFVAATITRTLNEPLHWPNGKEVQWPKNAGDRAAGVMETVARWI